MPALRHALLDDLPMLERLFERANDTPYDLSRVAAEKCFDRAASGEVTTLVHAYGGEIRAACTWTPRTITILAVDPKHRRRGIGTALLAEAEESIAASGRRVAIVGGESGNYFVPGVLASDGATIAFLERRGFAGGEETVNLEADLRLVATHAHLPGLRRAQRDEREALLDWIGTTFAPGWAVECAGAFRNDPPTIFVIEQSGAYVGFSAHEANNRGLGFYGPAGVEPSARGRGLGRALLLASLHDLRALGFRRVIIPWVSSSDFYIRSCGARIAHRFVPLTRDLTPEVASHDSC